MSSIKTVKSSGIHCVSHDIVFYPGLDRGFDNQVNFPFEKVFKIEFEIHVIIKSDFCFIKFYKNVNIASGFFFPSGKRPEYAYISF